MTEPVNIFESILPAVPPPPAPLVAPPVPAPYLAGVESLPDEMLKEAKRGENSKNPQPPLEAAYEREMNRLVGRIKEDLFWRRFDFETEQRVRIVSEPRTRPNQAKAKRRK